MEKQKYKTDMDNTTNISRRYDLDWLRILAILLLIPYHTAMIFQPNTFYVENNIKSHLFSIFTSYVDLWFMPLFFLVAGAAANYSLDSRTIKQYCLERLQRLLIPLIFGIFVLIPPVSYFGFISHHKNINLSYFQYYWSFFKFDFGNIRGFTGGFTPAHLWFILYLFIFSFIALPIFSYLKNKNGNLIVAKIAQYLTKNPPTLFVCVIPLTLTRMTAMVYQNPVYLLVFFIMGYLLILDPRWEDSFKNNNFTALILAISTTLFYLYADINEFNLVQEISLKHTIIQLLASLSTLCWVIVMLNASRNFFNKSNSFLKYFNSASYPIYILHMTFIVAIGFYVVQLNLEMITKYIIINFLAIISILLSYELMKKSDMTRFFLGMKLKR